MDAIEALALPTADLEAHASVCWRAIELVAPFASDELLEALDLEAQTLSATASLRAAPVVA